MYRLLPILCLIVAVTAGCSDAATGARDAAPSGSNRADSGRQPDSGTSAGAADARSDSVSIGDAMVCDYDPHADSDGDGLPDILEDTNRDCVFQEGETDPFNPDTDGDGLLDGDEDLDRNGVWDADRGELNPRSADTDGNGVPDSEELAGSVCLASRLGTLSGRRFSVGSLTAVVPASATPVGSSDGRLALFESSAGGVGMLADLGTSSGAVPGTEQWLAALGDGAREEGLVGDAERWTWRFSATLGEQTPHEIIQRIAGVVGLYPDFGSAGWTTDGGQVEVGIDLLWTDTVRRLAVAVVYDVVGAPRQWLADVTVDSIAPTAAARSMAACETVSIELPTTALDIVVAAETSDLVLGPLLPMMESVIEIANAREATGRSTRIWLVTGDAHVASMGGSALVAGPVIGATGLRPLVAQLAVGDPDQRVWMNLQDAVDTALRSGTEAREVVVVAAINREDSEFREGTNNERPGHPFSDPLEAGDDRAARVDAHGRFMRNRSARLIAVNVGTECAAPEDEPRSLVEVVRASGGTYLRLCGRDDHAQFRETLRRSAGLVGGISSSRDVIPGTVVRGDGLMPPVWPAPWSLGDAELAVGSSGDGEPGDVGDGAGSDGSDSRGPILDAAAAYMYWDRGPSGGSPVQ